jgi:hypothetical protein
MLMLADTVASIQGDQTGTSCCSKGSRSSAAYRGRGRPVGSVPARRLDLDGGGHDEHVAQRSDPPLVDGVVVGAQLHLALARGHLHRVRRAFVVARLLRRARLHVPHDACGVRTGRPLINSVRPVK